MCVCCIVYVEIEHALSIFDVTQASSLHEFSIRVLSQPRPPSAIWLHNLLISASHIPNTDDKYKFYKKNISKNLKLQISLKLTQNTKKKHQWSLKYDHMTTIMMMEKKKKRQIVVKKVSWSPPPHWQGRGPHPSQVETHPFGQKTTTTLTTTSTTTKKYNYRENIDSASKDDNLKWINVW